MDYWRLKQRLQEAQVPRVVGNLTTLRAQLSEEIPAKDQEDNLLLATWNIRDLGKTNRRGFGDRIPESHFYLAEVISRFDFVAVQEVNELPEWETIMDILGPSWDFIATDVTDPALGGNGERLTYVFDRRKVHFRNIAGEIVLPPGALVSENVVAESEDEESSEADVADKKVATQFRRTPFVASFRSGWFSFDICTVHLYYGAESGPKLEERIKEIEVIASYFGKRAFETLKQGTSLILLGDFNIVSPEHRTMEALLSAGFEVPEPLTADGSNVKRDKHYDQIAFHTTPEVLEYASGEGNAGVVDIYKSVFTPEQFEDFKDFAAASTTGSKKKAAELEDYYLDWRTYQFSDHLPMWVRLKTNGSAEYLEGSPSLHDRGDDGT